VPARPRRAPNAELPASERLRRRFRNTRRRSCAQHSVAIHRMTLFHLAVVNRAGKALLSYFFATLRSATGTLTPEAEDKWECELEAATRPLWTAASPVTVSCGGRIVLVAPYGSDMTLLLSGDPPADELELLDSCATLTDLLTTTCDNKPTSQQMLAFHGKIVLCLATAYSPVHLVTADSEKVNRQAKLKAV
jgi:hypothetical protein